MSHNYGPSLSDQGISPDDATCRHGAYMDEDCKECIAEAMEEDRRFWEMREAEEDPTYRARMLLDGSAVLVRAERWKEITMPARKSRWQEQHATCQETITRQRAEIEQLRAEHEQITAWALRAYDFIQASPCRCGAADECDAHSLIFEYQHAQRGG